jgi:hypothetical protein
MKKLILSLVFVLSASTMMNANTLESNENKSSNDKFEEIEVAATDCVKLARNVQELLEDAGVDMADANTIANAVYIICEAF